MPRGTEIEVRWNNTSVASPCPVCADGIADPPPGPYPFLKGTWEPVCAQCARALNPDAWRLCELVWDMMAAGVDYHRAGAIWEVQSRCAGCDGPRDLSGNRLPGGAVCQVREAISGDSDKTAVEALSWCPEWHRQMARSAPPTHDGQAIPHCDNAKVVFTGDRIPL